MASFDLESFGPQPGMSFFSIDPMPSSSTVLSGFIGSLRFNQFFWYPLVIFVWQDLILRLHKVSMQPNHRRLRLR